MDYLYIALGLLGLYFGAEWLVSGAVATARRIGISPLIASLVIVGFGTSLPELLVSVRAALSGAPGIALGNVVGSNIANILLIVGLAAVIFPIAGWDRSVRRDAATMVASAVILLFLVQYQVIDRIAGVVLLAILALYLLRTYMWARRTGANLNDDVEVDVDAMPVWKMGLLIVAGLVVLLFGAEFLIRGATELAAHFGVSDAVVGLTVVAVGTSLPELATAVVAATRRHSDVAIGNVTGSCIFNTLCILGATAAIAPLPVSDGFATLDVPVMLAASVFFAAMLFFAKTFHRATGAAMVAAYAGYIVYLI
ncbi:calcium/sodium antiporter [Martelella sp. AD-3]|uniref:calcium/sodium antiporter n=1 Tax=Martelella sp. AD-3 TaxID=686597 RepID=UPI000464083E|nr:calcium/sodium antiporter [Martelella sp. AD-3]AMM84714.1 sodium:calcium antiporter [Martelella sp. AD-3]MAM09904.1 sodium:calcium antiporter [Rhizobiaceae bacterium]